MKTIETNKSFDTNLKGSDYFVGDIHGQYNQLITRLKELQFNYEKDRLFAVGDIIDHGPDSPSCLNLLTEPWFFSVRGNHEDLLINIDKPYVIDAIKKCGGQWLNDFVDNSSQINYWRALIYVKMPLSFTVNTHEGKIGVIHADAPDDWKMLEEDSVSEDCIHSFLWGRNLFDEYQTVNNINVVVSGHINTAEPVVRKNRVWLDTIKKTNKLTIYHSSELLEVCND